MSGLGDDSSAKFPWWVRMLAVAYVLSRAVGAVGFFLLSGAACFLWVKLGEVNGWVVGLWLGGLACPAVCALFRWWFVRYGRRRWPEADAHAPESSSQP